ncbi:hypothetical protein GGF32_008727 [Allomyces javanicus]|nr:hypothetical protein GGF32_008727 [Allomyces javanicus]
MKTSIVGTGYECTAMVSMTPLNKETDWSPGHVAVVRSMTVEDVGPFLVDTSHYHLVILVSDFAPLENQRRIVIPGKLVKALTILEPHSEYLSKCGRSAVDDSADHHQALTIMLERVFLRFPNVSILKLGKIVLPAPALIRPIMVLCNSLAVLTLSVPFAWPAGTDTLTMPHLRDLTLRFCNARGGGKDKDGLTSLPIMAPTLEKLHLTAPRIHVRFLSVYLVQYRTMLTELVLHAAIDVVAKDMSRIALNVSVGWPKLRILDVPTTALFTMVAGAASDSLCWLVSLKLRPGKFHGAAVPGPLPALTALTELSLTGFLSLQPIFLSVMAEVAPRLSALQLVKCKIASESQRIVMPALKTCLIDRTVVPKDLTVFIDAPILGELRIEVDDPMAVRDMHFWPSITTLTVSNNHTRNDAVLHLRADALDALQHLTMLNLLGRVQWVDNQPPLLEDVTHLVAYAGAVNALAQEPHALPSLVDLRVTSTSEFWDDDNDFLQHLPTRPLKRFSAKAVHPRVFGAMTGMPLTAGHGLPQGRLAKADRDTPIDVLELVFDHRLFQWAVIQALIRCPKDQPLAKKVVVKVVFVRDVKDAILSISHTLRALANVMPWEAHLPAKRQPIRVELIVGKDAGAVVAPLKSMMAALSRRGHMAGEVLMDASESEV